MMIQLVIGDRDNGYLTRLQSYLEKNYFEEMEVVSFTDPSYLQKYLEDSQADVVLLDENFGLDPAEIAGKSSVVVLSEAAGVRPDGIPVIMKFRKPSVLYKDILNLYAENARPAAAPARQEGASAGGGAQVRRGGKVHMLLSFSGGTGVSTVAAAAARAFQFLDGGTFFLNLERFGSSSLFFSGEGSYNFENVLYALKGDSRDLGLKIKSSVRTDESGVDFLEPVSVPAYMMEMNGEDMITVVNCLKSMPEYRHIVVDLDFTLDQNAKQTFQLLDLADTITVISDGTRTANEKYRRTMETIDVMDLETKKNVIRKMSLLYNRFSSSDASVEIPRAGLKKLGSIPPVKHASSEAIMKWMSEKHRELFRLLA